MPTVALQPQGNGRYTGWSSIVGATFAWQAIASPFDGSTSYIVLPRLIGDAGKVSFPMFNQCEGMTPTLIAIDVWAQRGGASHPLINVGFQRAGTAAFHGTQVDAAASWAVTTLNFTTNPITGMAWDEGDLNGLEVMLQNDIGLGSNQITLVAGTMTYQESHFFHNTLART